MFGNFDNTVYIFQNLTGLRREGSNLCRIDAMETSKTIVIILHIF